MADFTRTQGRYLAFIGAYTTRHGYPPSESDVAKSMCVSPPAAHQMIKTLEKKGFLLRHPGEARSIEILIPDDELPSWNGRHEAKGAKHSGKRSRGAQVAAAPPANLYVLSAYIIDGPGDSPPGKRYGRTIEIRGDQTLEDLHLAIFAAFDRWDEQPYEFHLGKRPFDPKGPTFSGPPARRKKKGTANASTAKLDDLGLEPRRCFGYCFDMTAQWYHHIVLDRIEEAIPTVTYPRVIKRIGRSLPQYPND